MSPLMAIAILVSAMLGGIAGWRLSKPPARRVATPGASAHGSGMTGSVARRGRQRAAITAAYATAGAAAGFAFLFFVRQL